MNSRFSKQPKNPIDVLDRYGPKKQADPEITLCDGLPLEVTRWWMNVTNPCFGLRAEVEIECKPTKDVPAIGHRTRITLRDVCATQYSMDAIVTATQQTGANLIIVSFAIDGQVTVTDSSGESRVADISEWLGSHLSGRGLCGGPVELD